MTAIVLRADARALPLADASVDLIVTSPPYYGLRSYTDGGQHYAGQIGSEDTPAAWLQAMLDCTSEWIRVLKPGGSIFVNLGDKYSARADASAAASRRADRASVMQPGRSTVATAPRKSLLLLPERYRIACVDQLGLTARAVIVWDKPNGVPESVTDRVQNTHEDWVHLTLGPRYFAAVDDIRQPHSPASIARAGRNRFTPDQTQAGVGSPNTFNPRQACHPLGKLPGSVWRVPSEPLKVPDELGVDHFAAFPMEWPRRLIRGWSPSGICTACGEGRRPERVVDWDRVPHRVEQRRHHTPAQVEQWTAAFRDWCAAAGVTRQQLDEVCGTDGMGRHWTNPGRLGSQIPTPEQWRAIRARFAPAAELDDLVHATVPVRVSLLDWASTPHAGRHRNAGPKRVGIHTIAGEACACPDASAPTRPAIVLDPFGGTGTTALVASVHGRVGISVDRSADYCRIAEWRTTDPDQRAKAAGVRKPARRAKRLHDQPGLFDDLRAVGLL